MDAERKTVMISGRLPVALVERLDYVTRNHDDHTLRNRSVAIRVALELSLPAWEDRLRELGVLAAKARK